MASRKTNVSFEVLAMAKATRGFSETRAGIAGRFIVKQILLAGTAAQRGDIVDAMILLNDPTLLVGTPFHHRPNREDICVDGIWGVDEQQYAYKLICSLHVSPNVSSRGVVTIPNPPFGAISSVKLRWAQREWIRTAAEELGHVAQILLDRENPDQGRISQLLGAERSTVRSIVALEAERRYAVLSSLFGRKSRCGFYNKEADIYAFLIEAFGSDFIPNWVGIDYGHDIRRLIDDELVRQGQPNRKWPDANPSCAVSIFGK